MLQFLVLPGELAKLIFEPLDPDRRIAVIVAHLGKRAHRQTSDSKRQKCARENLKSG
jgi:hypothetical protein